MEPRGSWAGRPGGRNSGQRPVSQGLEATMSVSDLSWVVETREEFMQRRTWPL